MPYQFIKITVRGNGQNHHKLMGGKSLVTVPGASHLFEGPGKPGAVAGLAADWFKEYLEGPGFERTAAL